MDYKIPGILSSGLALFAAAFILSGCIFFPNSYKPVKVYDLKTPENIASEDIIIDIESFVNESPARRRFFYRIDKFQVENDDYNRWAQSPGLMLNRYLQTSFSKPDFPGENVSRYIISGGIMTFEINLDSKEARLAVEYNIRSYKDLSKSFKNFGVFSEKIEKTCPTAFVAAMTNASQKFALELKREITAFDNLLKEEKELEQKKKELTEATKAEKAAKSAELAKLKKTVQEKEIKSQ
jgi:hypothetical protein